MSPHALHAAMDATALTAASYAAYRYLPFVRILLRSRNTTIADPLWLNAGVGLTASGFVCYRAYWLAWRILPPESPEYEAMLDWGGLWGIMLLPTILGYYCHTRAIADRQTGLRLLLLSALAGACILIGSLLP